MPQSVEALCSEVDFVSGASGYISSLCRISHAPTRLSYLNSRAEETQRTEVGNRLHGDDCRAQHRGSGRLCVRTSAERRDRGTEGTWQSASAVQFRAPDVVSESSLIRAALRHELELAAGAYGRFTDPFRQ